jgi:hypothetical protein
LLQPIDDLGKPRLLRGPQHPNTHGLALRVGGDRCDEEAYREADEELDQAALHEAILR